ncbi:hypothetical protein [Halomonas sp. I5-271120]|uniref:hypothetical protein n=1 Tax=Halomonas sp. I5-271120 TaxID=3061632 RepID=UPI0027152045|nr:hypothetical protein [Halomonas sp. I5-271120]
MFYHDIKTAWEAGKVRIGLPAEGHGTKVTVEAPGVLGFKARLLSSTEKTRLAKAAKREASRSRAEPKAD